MKISCKYLHICTYFLLLLFLPPLLLLLQNLYRVTSVAALICMPRDTGTRTQSLWLLFFQWLFLVSLPLGVAATKLALIGSLFVANFVVLLLHLLFLWPLWPYFCCLGLLSVVAGRLEALLATFGHLAECRPLVACSRV